MFDPLTITLLAGAGVAGFVSPAVEARKTRIATRRSTEKVEEKERELGAEEKRRRKQTIQRKLKRRRAPGEKAPRRSTILTGSETGAAPATGGKTLLGA